MAAPFYEKPILNSPYEAPALHHALDGDGQPRGRSAMLKVNYRTSHQIRLAADRLLPQTIHDVDNREEERRGTISVFDGPAPEVEVCADINAEREHVALFPSVRAGGRDCPK